MAPPHPEESEKSEIFHKEGISLELGDLIEIISPSNSELNEQTFYIVYIDETQIEIINVANYELNLLRIDEDGTLSDESITQILLLDRSEVQGYARQNNLNVGTWVDLHFHGDIPIVMTCIVSNLEEDSVEFTSYPENEVFYIDFEYKGLPKEIPIEKIILRDPPASALYRPVDLQPAITDDERGEPLASIEWTETGESIIEIPDGSVPDENIRDVLKKIYLDANELFGEDLGVVFQKVEVKEEHNAFYATADDKFNELIDELLVDVPIHQRKGSILNKVHRLVERFKELRILYSKYNENGVIVGKRVVDYQSKQLAEKLLHMDNHLKWILPVVQLRKKLYLTNDEFENQAILDAFSDQSDLFSEMTESRQLEAIEQEYTGNRDIGENNKYMQYYAKWNDASVPVHAPTETQTLLAFEKEVRSDLEAIVSNYGDYQMDGIGEKDKSVEANFRIRSVKYFIQKFNLGQNHVKSVEMKNGKRVYVKESLIPGDKLSLDHLIMMPLPVVQYSQVFLPSTNVLMKTEMSQTPLYMHKIFHEKYNLPKFTIENLENELDYEKMEEENVFRFLNQPTAFVLNEEVTETRDKWEKYLRVIVPKVRTLVRILKKHIHDKISVVDVLKMLQPFLVYPEDITFGQFKEIRYFIKEKIAEIRTKVSTKSSEYSKLRTPISTETRGSVKQWNPIKTLFTESKNMQDHFYKHYLSNTETEKKDRPWTSSEDLLKIWNADHGQLFSNMMTFMLLSLVTPNKLLNGEEKAELDTMNPEKESVLSVKNKDCIRRYLAKKYTSIAELQKDNNKEEVYYDKAYDDTKYEILKKYEKEGKMMDPARFRDYLAENLVQKHDCPRDLSQEMAETMISGKKRVKTGEFAMVEIKPDIADVELKQRRERKELTEKEQQELEVEERTRIKRFYYKRVRDTWVRDDTLTEESFYDNNTLFCNIDTSCLKNQKSNVCEPVEHATLRMKKEAAENAIREFDKRFTVTMNELKTSIEKFIHSKEKKLVRSRELSYKASHKSDYVQFKIGEMFSKIEKIESPHQVLWNLILSQDDFSKRQEDIARFVSLFCRENLEGTSEDPHWYYCKDTNTKIVPISIARLANAFVNEEEDYSLFLDKICHEYGQLSEDGDSIVDKHSGYVLRKIDFVDQQEYEETTGFKVQKDAILEKETTTVVQEILQTAPKLQTVYDDELVQSIYNILFTICRNADLSIEEIGEFVIGYTTQMMRNTEIVLTEKKYKKRIEKSDKEMPPFSVYYHQTLLVIVASLFHVAVQTSIPSMKPKKTFPGCVREFSGFPMEGVENVGGLKYVACVMKGSASAIEPWNAIRKLSVDVLVKRIKDVLERYVLTDIQITNKYTKKREYIQLNPETEKIEAHGIQKWRHFLPPLVEFTIEKKVNGVGDGFHTETKELIQKGSSQQRAHFSVYRTHMMRNTFSMIEAINKVIAKKDSILKTANQTPYLESACCNDIDKSIQPLHYFAEEDASILLDNKRCQNSQIMLDRIHELSLPPTFFNNESTRFAYPALPDAVVSSNIYKSYMHYCNFDSDLPIPADLETICREKPEYYDPHAPVEDKINALASHGKKYDKTSLDVLMSRVYRRNQLPSVTTPVYMPIQVFRDILEHLNDTASTIVPDTLRTILGNVLEHYDPKVFFSEQDISVKTPFQKAMNRLRNYLTVCNKELHEKIMKYIDKYGNLDRNEYREMEDFLLNLCKWKMDEDIKKTGHYHDDGLYRVTQFVENIIYLMTRSIPSMIIHGKIGKKTGGGKHWGFSKLHYDDLYKILNSTLEDMRVFQGDEVMQQFLRQTDGWAAEIYRFIRHIPIHTSIVKNGNVFYSLFDKRTTYMLFQYIWYRTLSEYMETSEDDELLKVDIQEMRKENRKDNEEKMDRNAVMETGFARLPESETEIEIDFQEVQIISGMKSKLKEKVCQLLIAWIRLFAKEKKVIDISYEDIMKRVNTTKQNEKKSITDYFQAMNKDERKIENMFKQYKLERWNVGNQKGIYQYDKTMYDAEHDVNLKRALEDEMLANIHLDDMGEGVGGDPLHVSDTMMDVEELERLQTEEDDAFYENEAMDMRGLRDGFMDGVYYEEDGDDPFGYDD